MTPEQEVAALQQQVARLTVEIAGHKAATEKLRNSTSRTVRERLKRATVKHNHKVTELEQQIEVQNQIISALGAALNTREEQNHV